MQDGIAHDAMATGTEFTHGNGKYVYYGYTLKENGLFLPVVKLLDSEAEPFRPGSPTCAKDKMLASLVRSSQSNSMMLQQQEAKWNQEATKIDASKWANDIVQEFKDATIHAISQCTPQDIQPPILLFKTDILDAPGELLRDIANSVLVNTSLNQWATIPQFHSRLSVDVTSQHQLQVWLDSLAALQPHGAGVAEINRQMGNYVTDHADDYCTTITDAAYKRQGGSSAPDTYVQVNYVDADQVSRRPRVIIELEVGNRGITKMRRDFYRYFEDINDPPEPRSGWYLRAVVGIKIDIEDRMATAVMWRRHATTGVVEYVSCRSFGGEDITRRAKGKWNRTADDLLPPVPLDAWNHTPSPPAAVTMEIPPGDIFYQLPATHGSVNIFEIPENVGNFTLDLSRVLRLVMRVANEQ